MSRRTVAQNLNHVRQGMSTPWRGLRFMRHHRSLWPYTILASVLNMLIALLMFMLLVSLATAFVLYVHPRFPPTLIGRLLEAMLILTLIPCALASTIVGWFIIGGILCGHIYGKLAVSVERLLDTPDDKLRDIPLHYQIMDTARDVVWLAGVNIGCALVGLIPGIGTIVGTTGGLYFDCYIFGLDYLDFPLAVRGWRRDAKRRFAWQHRYHTIGLGATALIFSFVPVLGAILQTTSVTGAVLLVHHLHTVNDATDNTIKLPKAAPETLATTRSTDVCTPSNTE